MPNLLRADLYVLTRSRALWIALAVSSAMAVGYFVSARLIADGTYDMSISGSVAGFSDALALPLLGSLLIGVAAASDLENRTVHDRLLAAPRSVHVAVKTVMALALTAVVLLPYVIGSLVCLSAGWDLAPFLATTQLRVAANAGGGPVTATRLLAGLGLGAVSALVAVARLGFCLPIAFVSRRPLAVTAAGLAGGPLAEAGAVGALERGGLVRHEDLLVLGGARTPRVVVRRADARRRGHHHVDHGCAPGARPSPGQRGHCTRGARVRRGRLR